MIGSHLLGVLYSSAVYFIMFLPTCIPKIHTLSRWKTGLYSATFSFLFFLVFFLWSSAWFSRSRLTLILDLCLQTLKYWRKSIMFWLLRKTKSFSCFYNFFLNSSNLQKLFKHLYVRITAIHYTHYYTEVRRSQWLSSQVLAFKSQVKSKSHRLCFESWRNTFSTL